MRRITRIKNTVFLIAVSISLFLPDYSAHAFKMNVDPPRVELSLKPGKEAGGSITVVNHDEFNPIHVKVYINDLVYLPDGSNDFLPEASTPWTVSDWLKIGPTEFDIPPEGKVKVRYIAEVPKGVTGGRYGVAFFEVSPPLAALEGRTGAAINVRLGTIFLITAGGTEKYIAGLQDVSVGKPDENGAFDISCTVKNGGNVLIRPNGPVKIIDSSNKEIAELKLNRAKTGVLPGTDRQFSIKYDRKKLPPGEYFVQVVLDYGGEDFLGGQIGFTIE
jgi:P pilus assembly chaperone PapD